MAEKIIQIQGRELSPSHKPKGSRASFPQGPTPPVVLAALQYEQREQRYREQRSDIEIISASASGLINFGDHSVKLRTAERARIAEEAQALASDPNRTFLSPSGESPVPAPPNGIVIEPDDF